MKNKYVRNACRAIAILCIIVCMAIFACLYSGAKISVVESMDESVKEEFARTLMLSDGDQSIASSKIKKCDIFNMWGRWTAYQLMADSDNVTHIISSINARNTVINIGDVQRVENGRITFKSVEGELTSIAIGYKYGNSFRTPNWTAFDDLGGCEISEYCNDRQTRFYLIQNNDETLVVIIT